LTAGLTGTLQQRDSLQQGSNRLGHISPRGRGIGIHASSTVDHTRLRYSRQGVEVLALHDERAQG
jgi:hypothetical protein